MPGTRGRSLIDGGKINLLSNPAEPVLNCINHVVSGVMDAVHNVAHAISDVIPQVAAGVDNVIPQAATAPGIHSAGAFLLSNFTQQLGCRVLQFPGRGAQAFPVRRPLCPETLAVRAVPSHAGNRLAE